MFWMSISQTKLRNLVYFQVLLAEVWIRIPQFTVDFIKIIRNNCYATILLKYYNSWRSMFVPCLYSYDEVTDSDGVTKELVIRKSWPIDY